MKLLNIVGARPQFIKVGPILRAMKQYTLDHPDRSIQEILVHTGISGVWCYVKRLKTFENPHMSGGS